MNLKIKIFIVALIFFDFFIWRAIIFNGPNKNFQTYFLDVGQGDSELAVLPGNIKILIDGGPNNKILENLSKIFPPTDRYIDLIILSHAETDHFTGLIEVAKRYQVGAFIFNGLDGKTNAWPEFLKILKNKNVPIIALAAGDRIKYLDNRVNVIWPEKNNLPKITKTLNETALVLILKSRGVGVLFAGDIGFKTENQLLEKKYNLNVDILKVGHHGSKFSTSEEFLKAVNPKISIIEVGKNSYGHPTKEVLNRLASIKSKIFRTDRDGLVKITTDNGKLLIFKSD